MPNRWMSLVGMCFVIAVAVLFSRDRRAIRWKTVFMGLALQTGFAVAILGIPSMKIPGVFRIVFETLNDLVNVLVDLTGAGSKFLFGPLAEVRDPWGFIFAFRVLPTIIFFSALMALLYHLKVLQKIVKGFAFVMQKTMKTSGAETLCGAANVFMGQTEAPLLIRPFIERMTPSEIYCVMVGGMSTVAAGVEAAYIGMLKERLPDIAGHILTASAMGAMGALVIAKIVFPEKGTPETAGQLKFHNTQVDSNSLEAIARGTSEGLHLALNVGAMLVSFICVIALCDTMLAKVGMWIHLKETLSFSLIMGVVCKPVAFLLGVPWSEAEQVGRLLGQKVVINEFVAYVDLAKMASTLSDRTMIISSYALCGFANFASIGIQLGGLSLLAPNQRSTVAKLGMLAVLGGNLASFLSACVAGLLF